jgi:hypothetical protein
MASSSSEVEMYADQVAQQNGLDESQKQEIIERVKQQLDDPTFGPEAPPSGYMDKQQRDRWSSKAHKFGAAVLAYEFDEDKVERDENGKFIKNDNPLPDRNAEQRDPDGRVMSNGDEDWDESLYEEMGGEYEEFPEGYEEPIERAPRYEV